MASLQVIVDFVIALEVMDLIYVIYVSVEDLFVRDALAVIVGWKITDKDMLTVASVKLVWIVKDLVLSWWFAIFAV